MDAAGHFTRLEGDECRQLLRGQRVGRVSWLSSRGLQALPVTYSLVGDDIIFRTSPDSVLGELAESVPVCFQIDDLDPETLTGWSVLVQGVARRLEGDPPGVVPDPWAPGERPLTVIISPATYSGRAVAAG